jgi:hypothetical protein
MILLNSIAQIGTLPDANGFQVTPRSVLKLVCGITGQDRLPIGLAAVDHNPFGSAIPLERFAQEVLGRGQIAPLTEPELDRVAIPVDGAVKIHSSAAHFDIRLVDMPLAGNGSLVSIETFQQFGRVPDDPSMNGRIIDRDVSLSHHLFKISQAQFVGQIPPHRAGLRIDQNACP